MSTLAFRLAAVRHTSQQVGSRLNEGVFRRWVLGTPGLWHASRWHNVLVLTDSDKESEDAGGMKVLCLVMPHKFGDPEEGLDPRTHETCARCGLTRLIRPTEELSPSVDQRNILGGPNAGGF